jgi:hypothetical protein
MEQMIRVESIGSIWWIDEENMKYSRTPKVERPRDFPANGDGTPLKDLKWFPFTHWVLLPVAKKNFWERKYSRKVVGVVQIHYPGVTVRRTPLGTGCFVHAPVGPMEYKRLNDEYD